VDVEQYTNWAFICEASDCRWRGSQEVREALAAELQRRDCGDVAVVRTGCLSLCGAGPALVTYPKGDVHLRVERGDVPSLAAQLARGEPLRARVVRAPAWYRENILSRLAYFVQLIRRRTEAARLAGQPNRP
jgi:(2Fe-2S) ferredoxin